MGPPPSDDLPKVAQRMSGRAPSLHASPSPSLVFWKPWNTFKSLLSHCSGGVRRKCVCRLYLSKTKCHRLSGLNGIHLFLTVLEAGNSKSRCQWIWFLVRTLFPACRWPSSRCVLTRWRELRRASSLVSFLVKDSNLIIRTPPSRPPWTLITSQRPHLQTPSN